MLASLTSFTAGDISKKAAFEKDSQSFSSYFEQLKPLEQKPQEIANLQKINTMYEEIKSTAERIFTKFDPTGRVAALKAVNDMEHKLFYIVERYFEHFI